MFAAARPEHVDVRVLTGEADGELFLLLGAKADRPLVDEFGGQVVSAYCSGAASSNVGDATGGRSTR